jgi:hypothetical protein
VINLFCSAEKVQLFETTFEQPPFYTISKDDEEELKQLIARLDRFKDVEWSGSSVKVLIGPQSRAVPRKYGALPPVGTTGTAGKFFPPIGTTGTAGKQEENDDTN